MNYFLKDKIKELALKHRLTQTEITNIFYSQFKHAAHIMGEDFVKEFDDRRSVKIKGLCTFEYNPYRSKKILKVKQESDARKNMAESLTKD